MANSMLDVAHRKGFVGSTYHDLGGYFRVCFNVRLVAVLSVCMYDLSVVAYLASNIPTYISHFW